MLNRIKRVIHWLNSQLNKVNHWLPSLRHIITRKGRVFVGVSGGVDSSVSLALLKEQGYEVVGVFIRTWQPDFIECTWRDERRDAMRVCAHLQVPFVELNLEDEYKQGVADYMIREYALGRTPNPDVMCNKEVKFGGFLQWALKQGADAIATGHYAINREGKLYRGVDESKDQSYFLWTLTAKQLKQVLFPIGHLPKQEVRRLAEKFNIPVATKKDSQGICFIGEINMKDFLAHYFPEKQGIVITSDGTVIGYHPGALFFTLGERHGFTITKKTHEDAPYYVIAKDIHQNTLTVSQTPHKGVGSTTSLLITDAVWRTPFSSKREYTAQVRYHGNKMKIRLRVDPENRKQARVTFDQADYSIASGQSVVIYDGDCCIGGGIVA